MIKKTGGGHPPKRENPHRGQVGRAFGESTFDGADIMNSTQHIDTNAIIPFTVKVVSITDKAVGFFTEADGITRWIPIRNIMNADMYKVGERYGINVPLWRLKKRDGSYPAWAVAQAGEA